MCFVPLGFSCHTINALVDTGSTCSIVSSEVFLVLQQTTAVRDVSSSEMRAVSASGDMVSFESKVILHFKIGHLSWNYTFQVAKILPVPIIIGSDFLAHTRAVVNMATRTLSFPYGSPGAVFSLQQPDTGSDDGGLSRSQVADNLSADQKQRVFELLAQFPDTITPVLGQTHLVNYRIRVNSTEIVRSRPYQYAPPKLAQMREHIDELLRKGVIRPSDSPYASPAFLVPKKGGKTRMVVDYRGINKILDLEATPMPTIESAFMHLGQARWFTLLDLNQAYNQIPLDENSKKYTAFVVPWAQYEFNNLPFGLASGSMVLTSLIDKIFGDIKFRYIYNFFDDLCVFSDGSFEDHLEKVEEVLHRLSRAGLTVNPDKIQVAANQIQFLGHTFSNKSVSIHPDRTSPIDGFPVPKNIKQLSRFLGMAAFYCRFIPNFASLTQPLNQLKRKGVKFIWGPSQQASFEQIKAALVSSPILRMPDFSRPFVLHTDASGSALGAVLSQNHNGHLLPVAYASRALNKHELNYATLQLECLAVVFAFQKFQQYLEHREFELHTDCSALSWLLNHPRQTGKLARWTAFLNAFKFTIAHLKGSQNVVADCLSRLFENSDDTQAPPPVEDLIPTPSHQRLLSLFGIPEVFKDIILHQMEDPEISKIVASEVRPPNFSVQQGVLVHTTPNQTKPRVVIPQKLFGLLFKYYHQSPGSAHMGIKKTLARIKPFFWAEGLQDKIRDMVRSCPQCQQCKQAPNTRIGHLASEVVSTPWSKVFIDHIGPLPRSTKGNQFVLVLVDAFSKFSIFIPTRSTKAHITTSALASRVFSIFGPPKILVSDNVSSFKSHHFREFCLEYGVQHIFTSPYYPNPSHAERVNKNLKVAMRIFHNEHQQLWDQNIHWFQIAFNSATHESTKATPAKLLCGREIVHPLELQWDLHKLLGETNQPQDLDAVWAAALDNLRKAHRGREAQYNRGRLPNLFNPGDTVMYKKVNISNAADQINQKLLPTWSPPCVIEVFTSPVTVRLVDPQTGRFIRKAHVSQLKRFFRPST